MNTPRNPVLAAAVLAIGCLSLQSTFGQLPTRSTGEQPRDSKSYQINAAKQVDRLIGGGFKKSGMRPTAKTNDEEFLRRTYLNAIGRIPTYEEASAFLADASSDKRTKLVDTLLDSDGYDSHMFNFWADLLRVKDYFSRTSGAPYIDWLKHSVEANKPYNVMVRELLTSKGSGWVEGNGAVGYFVRDLGMPLDNMSNTTRIFLGTRMECAQCHDHPFDDWKQMDFYKMAAFTNGITGTNESLARKVFQNEIERSQPKPVRNIGRMLRYSVFDFAVRDTGRGNIALPYDYQYNDGDPGEMIAAKSLRFGKSIGASRKGEDPGESRFMFAEWLTSPENPRFNMVIANRMWKRVMGIGQFEPVDNFSDATAPANPELMNFLVDLMKDLDYDLKAFQRVLYNTYTYQLGTFPEEHARGPYHFGGRQMQRLSAEQVWDSLLTLNAGNPDANKRPRQGGHIYYNNRPVLVGKKSMDQVYKEVTKMQSANEFWNYAKDLLRQIEAERRSGAGRNSDESMMMMAYGGKKGGKNMRASELPQPTPPGHFLRAFGQSSREIIEGASTESDVTQVLEILNGHVEDTVVSDSGAQFYKDVAKASSPEEKVDRLFLSILSRKPSDREKELFVAEVSKGENGVRNCASALICSDEFMFLR
ncbi:MAG: DUF1549 domain-containing protein [Verrucomicrobiota bacterium]